jgi:ABC-2 type transport system permease protein
MPFLKVKAVAQRDFQAVLSSRVFQLSLVLVPLFSLGLGYLTVHLGPVAAAGAGAADPAKTLVPVGSLVLLFMMVMLTTPQMMSSIIEEKSSRISEVLLASVSPFDLMLGKLLACCATAALVGLLYLGLGLVVAWHFGLAGLFSPLSLFYLVLFQGLAVVLHGSLYLAVGAACSEPRDGQGLLAPLVLLSSVPLMTLGSLMQDPNSPLATALSLFPLSAPFVLCFRLNSQPGPPQGEVLLSVAITLGTALFWVWAASRIFRVGLLAQGRLPGPAELWRWIFAD